MNFDSLIVRFSNAIPRPEYIMAYKEYIKDGYDTKFCLIGIDNAGLPYLALSSGNVFHYNGSEVEKLWEYLNKYSPKTNKILTSNFSGIIHGFRSQKTLENLYIAERELSCSLESWDGEYTFYNGFDFNNIVSEEEYNRIENEINNKLGSDAKEIETWYSSVDEAYLAYISNRGSTSASGSASATNTLESADTAIATDNSASEYILKDSSSRYLTKDDLQGLSADDCRIARNEIYARHGRKFDDEGLQSHFNACSWYQGTIEPSDFEETMLSDIEVANKNLIVEYEKEKGYR